MKKRIAIESPISENDGPYAETEARQQAYEANLKEQRKKIVTEDEDKAKQERINKTARDVLTRLGIDQDVLNHLDE